MDPLDLDEKHSDCQHRSIQPGATARSTYPYSIQTRGGLSNDTIYGQKPDLDWRELMGIKTNYHGADLPMEITATSETMQP